MLEANELRIGNWVEPAEPEYKGKYFRVQSGDIKHIQEGSKTYKYQPIPLTLELLEKVGFMKDSSDGKFYGHDFPPIYFIYDNQWSVTGMPFSHTMEHLHQLQNLYFALTGTELTINL